INHVRRQWAIGAGRPGFWISNQRDVQRIGHLRTEAPQGPAPAKRSPRFEMGILQTPLCERVARPFIGALHSRRRGQTRANYIAQIRERLHHLRSIQTLIANLRDRIVWIERRLLLSLWLLSREVCGGVRD